MQTRTAENRYPAIFDAIGSLLPDRCNILSFGCSTGEEILSLQKRRPKANVFGCEVNTFCLQKLKERFGTKRVMTCRELQSKSIKFDCITALSVLCKWPKAKDREDISEIYPFKGFDATIAMLDTKLKDSGLLVVYNTNYRVMDSTSCSKYTPLILPGIDQVGEMQLFGKDGRRLANQHNEVFFKKN